MRSCFLHVIFIFIFFLPVSGHTKDIYVSSNGSDKNNGTKESPYYTLEKAKKEVLKNKVEDCTIWLADGIYRIEKPVVFDSRDFDDSARNLSINALPGTNPVLSGGKQIKNWQKNKNGFWEATLKMEAAPRELFVDEKRAIRARFPNAEYLRVKKVGNDRRTHFFFEKDDFPMPESTKNVELVLLHDWSISRIGIKEIDLKKKKLAAVDSIGAKNPSFFNLDHWEKQPRYYLENDMAFLDADYEWYFDSNKNKIYLKLPDSQNPENLDIVIPVAESLVELIGNENGYVKNIHFDGIAFKHCAWKIPEMGYCGVQACHFDNRQNTNKVGWSVAPAAIKAFWAENISFANCSFENLGATGLWFSTACKNCKIKQSRFYDISGNGIMIGEGRDRLINGKPWWQEKPEQTATGNTIENCTIKKCGAQFYGAVGVWCGLTAETIIKNNHVFDLPYTGISIGWMWSPVPTPCRQNVIDGNHIHHIMKILSDGGGIYSLGLQPGSKLINNHIHDVRINAGRAESNGMFLDEGTTDVVVANNLIYNIAKSPLRFHKATTNLVTQNYLFCTNENPPIRYNRTEESDIKKVDNMVFAEEDENYSKELKKAIQKWEK